MRIEKVVSNLLDATKQDDVSPARLARMFQLTLQKIAETSAVGKEAQRLVQTNILRDALTRDLNIQRIRRRRSAESAAVEPTPRKTRKPRVARNAQNDARKSA